MLVWLYPTMSIDNVLIGEGETAVNVPAPLTALEKRRPETAAHFRRNHFPTPPVDPDTWALALGGAMSEPMVLPAVTLHTFEHRILPVVLECAGHRRAELDQPGDGLPWGDRKSVV